MSLKLHLIRPVVFVVPILLTFYMSTLPSTWKTLPLVSLIKDNYHSICGPIFKTLDSTNLHRSEMPKTPVYFFSHGGVSEKTQTDKCPI